ncbi:MAG: GH92 family glycosyl hydrolase [Planctomycetota bacterium]
MEGFSFTHMSGIGWYGDLGNLQVMPTTGELVPDREKTKTPFSHDREEARAGYYSVVLDRYRIRAELTAAPRSGLIRFTYPRSETSRIQVDLARRIGMRKRWIEHGLQLVKLVDDRTVEGRMHCPHADGGWGRGGGRVTFTQHFSMEFSRPIKTFGIWDKQEVFPGRREHEGRNVGFYVEFATRADEQVLVKAGVSYVSLEGARANLEHDIPDWDFDACRARARELWADALRGVAIEGGTDAQREAFATALYHCFIDPRSVSDVDGRYIGADNKPHRAKGFVYRSVFSGWDVFRSQFSLLTIIRPDIVNDEVNSLVQMAELSGRGYLPRWEILNSYSGCMVGDPAVSVIAEAYLKGIRGYDAERAYAACRQTVLGPKTNRNGFSQYIKLGYVPGSVSCTLENAYFDYCAARFAELLGKKDDAAKLYTMSMNYRNIFDSSVGNMRGKMASGEWAQWRGLTRHGQGCVESNPYQQGWFVPHDVRGLINLMGGREAFLAHLVPFFEKTPRTFKWNDHYNHANEPVHHVAYLFPYARAPWLTQKWVRTVMDCAYGPGVKGLCGNEDVGQMSAWYLLSAMGFHPVAPCSDVYVIGSPLFRKLSVRLDPAYHRGKSFTILAPGNSPQNIYVQSARLNGKVLSRAWITHDEITSGGTLEFDMGPEPNREWASGPASVPPSLSPRVEYTALEVRVDRAARKVIATARVASRGGLVPMPAPLLVRLGERIVGRGEAEVAPDSTARAEIVLDLEGVPEGRHAFGLLGRTAAPILVPDVRPPKAVRAKVRDGKLIVTFSEPVELRSARDVRNYALSGGERPTGATLSADGKAVTLAFRHDLTGAGPTLRVSGVRDRAADPNTMAEATLVFTNLDAEVETHRTERGWDALPSGAPSREDLADRSRNRKATFSYVEGFARPRPEGGASGRSLPRLNDGMVARNPDDTSRCTWLDYASEGRIVLDMGGDTGVRRVNTYSWHRSDRAPQRFVLYGMADGAKPDPKAKALELSWMKIAEVDSRRLGPGGKHVSSVRMAGRRLRYLLWVMAAPNAAGQGSFLTEIDVH